MSTLTNGVDTITPELITRYASSSEQRTIAHRIIGRRDPDVTFAPPMMRSGTLELLIVTEADSAAAEIALNTPAPWSLTDPDRPSIAMSFAVVGGTVQRTLDDETRDLWLVTFTWQETLA